MPCLATPTADASPHRQVVITAVYIVYTRERLRDMPDSSRAYPVVEPLEWWLLERSELLSVGWADLPGLSGRVR